MDPVPKPPRCTWSRPRPHGCGHRSTLDRPRLPSQGRRGAGLRTRNSACTPSKNVRNRQSAFAAGVLSPRPIRRLLEIRVAERAALEPDVPVARMDAWSSRLQIGMPETHLEEKVTQAAAPTLRHDPRLTARSRRFRRKPDPSIVCCHRKRGGRSG